MRSRIKESTDVLMLRKERATEMETDTDFLRRSHSKSQPDHSYHIFSTSATMRFCLFTYQALQQNMADALLDTSLRLSQLDIPNHNHPTSPEFYKSIQLESRIRFAERIASSVPFGVTPAAKLQLLRNPRRELYRASCRSPNPTLPQVRPDSHLRAQNCSCRSRPLNTLAR